ncbi:MAG: hypothetical protein H0U59_12295 [Gemmatimonadaceae bacterium]|nr:hypothetical protein [Gemmatimonadaceae bacterium]
MSESLVIFLVTSAVVSLGLWLILAGDREQDIEDDEVRFTTSYPRPEDEDPTLDTRGPEDR